MLNTFAFCAPDAIPVRLFFADMDEVTRLCAMGELLTHSLVTPTGSQAVTVHRLVQAVTREHLGPEAYEWADNAHRRIIAFVPQHSEITLGFVVWVALESHIHTILGHLPIEHCDALATRFKVANFTDFGIRARDLLAELLPARERALGAHHRDTLIARYNLAHWTGEAGDVAGARDLLDALLPIQKRVLGVDHSDTLITWNALARRTAETGDFARACDLLSELLPYAKRSLPDLGQPVDDFEDVDDSGGGPPPLADLSPIDELARDELYIHLDAIEDDLMRWRSSAG